ncbi:MATE family efflux transporter [Bacteroides sp.]|uniref:MATE family efflux transporter n=1 Tax=Bacteroides sp. TaxID=29523 RepID=UPI0026376789|nr:MATE family efflux transporter [Bacteroides sp.]
MQVTYRTIWQTTYPILLSLLVEQLIGITDTAFLGHLGEVELAASALAGVCYLILYVIGSGFGVGLQILIARLNGKKDQNEIRNIFGTGIYFLLVLSFLIIGLSKVCFPFLLNYFIHSDTIYQNVIAYMDWRLYGLPFSFLIVAFRAYFVGVTHTKILAVSSSVMVLVNIVFNYVLIFGKLGFPAWGISGAAIGSTIAEGVAALILTVYIAKGERNIMNISKLRIRWQYMKRILNLSTWTMLQSLLSFVSWFMFFITIEHLGEQSLAVSNVVRSISAIPFIFVMAFASTGSAFISNILGTDRRNPISNICKKITLLCYTTCLPIVCIGVLLPTWLLQIYTDNQLLVGMAINPLYVMFSSYVITVPAFVLYYAVSGTGNTFSSLVIGLLSLSVYCIYIVLIGNCRPDLLGLWASEHAYALSIFLFSAFYLWRFNWRKKIV